MSSPDCSFQNVVFWNLFEIFSGRNHFKINISPHSESKSYQVNSIKSCSSRSFQQHQRNIPILLKFSATIWFNLIFSEEIIQHSRTFALQVPTAWNQAHAPLLIESFPNDIKNTILKHPGSVDLITTKQNKLPSFIDRWQGQATVWHTPC